MSHNKKGFSKYISSKQKTRENVRPLLSDLGALVTEDIEKAKLLNAFFASALHCQGWPSGIPVPGGKRGSLEKGRSSLG